jgi:peptide/nickel transport system substrate-binding protein
VSFLRGWSTRQKHASVAVVLLIFLASSCTAPAPKTAAVNTSVPTTEPTSIPHATEISFGLIGGVTAANGWSLFDTTGYSYNNYAVRSGYWPRLYHLSTLSRQFVPLAASGLPSPVQLDGNFYAATVPLRSDLTWTDGSPLTADDVAFTINTVLSFQLGFDWHDYYNPEWLDHAEATDAQTVKFYFKKPPNVGAWQYGALQGPILQKAYWTPRIAPSVALLPSTDLLSQLDGLKIQVTELQKRVDALNAEIGTLTGDAARQTQASLQHQQGDLDKASNDLAKAQGAFDSAMEAARVMLYSLNDEAEPHLGIWIFKASGKDFIENEADPKYAPGHPGINQVTFHFYPTEEAAINGYSKGEVNAILMEGGLSAQSLIENPSLQTVMKSSNHNLRFLVFNPISNTMNDRALHQAFACMIDQDEMVKPLNGQVMPLESYILPAETPWINTNAPLPCKGLDHASRIEQAVRILKSAGYSWKQEPSATDSGQGLMLPNGGAFPNITLLVPSDDEMRVAAASYIQHAAHMVGIPLTARPVSSIDLNYAVFSSPGYDMALLGWHVSSFPGYLCDWFGTGNQFHYDGNQIMSLCDSMLATNDLDIAHQQVFGIQSVLAQELPFIPLFAGVTHDVYRNVTYPFDQIPDGLSGAYGVPEMAVP